MDKGFNDDELADIMNEIESLEKEFSEEITPEETVTAAEAPVDDVESNAEVTEEPVMEVSEVEEVEAAQDDFVSEEAVSEEPTLTEAIQEVEPIQEVEAIEATEVVHEVQEIDAEMSDVVEELSTMPVEELEAVHATAHDDSNVHQIRQAEPKLEQVAQTTVSKRPQTNLPESSLNFSVQGDMKLNLFFNIGGKSVQLNIKEEGLEIELDGGMKFSIPLDHSEASEKKAA